MILVVFGLIYLVLQSIALITAWSRTSSATEDFILLNKSELYADIRTLVTIGLAIASGILLFRRKKLGWVFGIPVLLLFIIILAGILYTANAVGESGTALIIGGSIECLLLVAFMFLLSRPAIEYLQVKRGHVIGAIVLSAVLLGMYFW
jgi:hypothetical protein